MNWKIVRDAAASPWKLADAKPGEELDNAKASSVASHFTAASFADVLPPDAPVAETGLDKPSTVRIETFDNFVYELRIGKLTGENYPVLVSVKGDLPKERTPGRRRKTGRQSQARPGISNKAKAAHRQARDRTKTPGPSLPDREIHDRPNAQGPRLTHGREETSPLAHSWNLARRSQSAGLAETSWRYPAPLAFTCNGHSVTCKGSKIAAVVGCSTAVPTPPKESGWATRLRDFDSATARLSLALPNTAADLMVGRRSAESLRCGSALSRPFRPRRAVLVFRGQVGFERAIFPESADAEHAETNDTAFLIHAPHYSIAPGRSHETGRVRKSHFEIIMLSVKPQFHFIDHNVFRN